MTVKHTDDSKIRRANAENTLNRSELKSNPELLRFARKLIRRECLIALKPGAWKVKPSDKRIRDQDMWGKTSEAADRLATQLRQCGPFLASIRVQRAIIRSEHMRMPTSAFITSLKNLATVCQEMRNQQLAPRPSHSIGPIEIVTNSRKAPDAGTIFTINLAYLLRRTGELLDGNPLKVGEIMDGGGSCWDVASSYSAYVFEKNDPGPAAALNFYTRNNTKMIYRGWRYKSHLFELRKKSNK